MLIVSEREEKNFGKVAADHASNFLSSLAQVGGGGRGGGVTGS